MDRVTGTSLFTLFTLNTQFLYDPRNTLKKEIEFFILFCFVMKF